MKKPRAVFTMVYNEKVFLPIWLRYYSRFFAPEDIYVLDHGSTDGSTDGLGFVRVSLGEHKEVNCDEQLHTVQNKQHELIGQYETVLYTDVDEMVVPDPVVGDLGKYIEGFRDGFVNCRGLEILHMAGEPSLDSTRPILEQRSHWFPNDQFFSKPLLTRIPMHWDIGCHSSRFGFRQDSLYLIHLHRVDYDLCLARHRQIAARPHSRRDIANGWGAQRRIVSDGDFRNWFYGDTGALMYARAIPEIWKTVGL